ncbi:DNA-deoxyinosine glycosylase [Luteimonas deserti]|uniref:DNA-deoxyinosine glycosylase n=1 Tax=Luteimonas deserti TaxID=2752306 RepID=A0A7Z0TVK8_9GAMM|nr:DNA-deoxyinosine glycosylase [Luteimonas deserti]NYZ63966.1 DNA-deoxyinosine glycosylase [Luteimonas deserti]
MKQPVRARSFPPVVGPGARVLVLGSMPGRASLDTERYYAHPRNLFWPIMGTLVDAGPGYPYAERLARLRRAGIALWDVAAECTRAGSLDAEIERDSVVANDIGGLLARHPGIVRILFNGAAAETLYRRHVAPLPAGAPACMRLPSTSPAHAAMPLELKLAAWREGLAP